MKRRLGFWQAMTFLGYLAGAAIAVGQVTYGNYFVICSR